MADSRKSDSAAPCHCVDDIRQISDRTCIFEHKTVANTVKIFKTIVLHTHVHGKPEIKINFGAGLWLT
jgi:uncharacterized MAPEG superfamily protein